MANNPLTTNLAPLTTAATTIAALAGLVMVTPITENTQGYQPLPKANSDGTLPPFPPSLLFQYEGEQILNIGSDVTDHYIEDNTSVQDQIALKPEIFTTRGFIGELTDVLPPSLEIVRKAANVLISVSGYLPQLSITAYNAYLQALLLYESAASIAQSAVSAYNSLGGLGLITSGPSVPGAFSVGTGMQNKQQVMFQSFYGYWNNRTLFNVQTPWCILTNMVIMDLRAIQDETTRMITDFEVTFKKIRTVSSVFSQVKTQGRAFSQVANRQNNGTTSGSQVASSEFGSNITTVLGAA